MFLHAWDRTRDVLSGESAIIAALEGWRVEKYGKERERAGVM